MRLAVNFTGTIRNKNAAMSAPHLTHVCYFSYITWISKGDLDHYGLNLAYISYGLPQNERICINFDPYSMISGF